MPETAITVPASIWLMDVHNPEESVLDGATGHVDVERTDKDEVAFHFTLPNDTTAVSSVYLTRAQAVAVAGLLQMEAAKP